MPGTMERTVWRSPPTSFGGTYLIVLSQEAGEPPVFSLHYWTKHGVVVPLGNMHKIDEADPLTVERLDRHSVRFEIEGLGGATIDIPDPAMVEPF